MKKFLTAMILALGLVPSAFSIYLPVQWNWTGPTTSVNGESLDIGIIDDPIKGREAANSQTVRDKTWDSFADHSMGEYYKLCKEQLIEENANVED